MLELIETFRTHKGALVLHRKDGKYIISYTTILGDQVKKEFESYDGSVGCIEALKTKINDGGTQRESDANRIVQMNNSFDELKEKAEHYDIDTISIKLLVKQRDKLLKACRVVLELLNEEEPNWYLALHQTLLTDAISKAEEN